MEIYLAIIIIIIIFLAYHFFNYLHSYFQRDICRKVPYYEIQFRPGDLIFERNLCHINNFATICPFYHMGIILPIRGEMCYVELRPEGGVYASNIEQTIRASRGITYFVRQATTETVNNLHYNKIPEIISKATELHYTASPVLEYYSSYRNCYIDSCNQIVQNKCGICTMFVLWIMQKLGILMGNERHGIDIMNYLAYYYDTDKKIYGSLQMIDFSPVDRRLVDFLEI